MIEADILKALQTGAIAACEASTIFDLPDWDAKTRIKPMAITLDPIPNDGRYIEFMNIPNNRSGDYWDDSRVYQGNFRIILHWMPDQNGPYAPAGYLDEIAAYFTKDRELRSGSAVVRIYDNPSASGPLESGSELLFPLTLPYRCFAPS